jgi:hypothetical protein
MSILGQTCCVLMCAVAFALEPSHASSNDREPVRRELQLIYVFEGEAPEFLFVIGQSGFKSVESLKKHLETWPPGSELEFAPGCIRIGGEPLLSSEKEMAAFKAFLAQHEIKFVLVPSG